MVAPLAATAAAGGCALWFLAMDPRPARRRSARKLTLPIDAARRAVADPFELRIGDATLDRRRHDRRVRGRRLGSALDASAPATTSTSTRCCGARGWPRPCSMLPHADLEIEGTSTFGGERLELAGARGGQAHLWGSKHAALVGLGPLQRLHDADGEPVPGRVRRRRVGLRRRARAASSGPSTPVVGRLDGRDFSSISPAARAHQREQFALTGWRFEAVDGSRKLIGEVDADRDAARRGHLPRPRRRARLLLQQRDCLDAPAPVRARPRGRRLGARRALHGATAARTSSTRSATRSPTWSCYLR